MSTEDLLFLNGLRTQFEFEVNLGEISGQFPLFRQPPTVFYVEGYIIKSK